MLRMLDTTWLGEAGADLNDTMQPLVHEGLVDLVDAGHRVCDGVRLEAAPGTLGQVAVVVESGEERAVITGDLVHHPVQFIEPDVPSLAAGPAPTAGLLQRGGDGTVRFVADDRH